MPFKSVDCSPEFLCLFNLPEQIDKHHRYLYSDLLLHTKQNAAFFKRTHSDRGEEFVEFALVIEDHFFRVAAKEKRITDNRRPKAPQMELHFISYTPISNEIRRLTKRVAKQINLANFGIKIGSISRRILIDETLPPKPRSIIRLRRMLNKLAHKTDKYIFINSMEAFIPFVLSVDEAKAVYADTRKTDGKYLSEKALLIFELGYEKCKEKIEIAE